jgi:hypothetical protein
VCVCVCVLGGDGSFVCPVFNNAVCPSFVSYIFPSFLSSQSDWKKNLHTKQFHYQLDSLNTHRRALTHARRTHTHTHTHSHTQRETECVYEQRAHILYAKIPLKLTQVSHSANVFLFFFFKSRNPLVSCYHPLSAESHTCVSSWHAHLTNSCAASMHSAHRPLVRQTSHHCHPIDSAI